MDMSFANQALAAEFMARHHEELERVVLSVPEAIDRSVAKLKLQPLQVGIDRLTRSRRSTWRPGTREPSARARKRRRRGRLRCRRALAGGVRGLDPDEFGVLDGPFPGLPRKVTGWTVAPGLLRLVRYPALAVELRSPGGGARRTLGRTGPASASGDDPSGGARPLEGAGRRGFRQGSARRRGDQARAAVEQAGVPALRPGRCLRRRAASWR